ncbi:hypothetical protein TNCT_610451 [Trichonephila clavata]|uniref:Uncharacterized protein n=1 Tax=Trichonephila clavata TaxID=2740835 RepID=A0A8X6KCQ7_TRICU|nr:hypothetical protein TNCT_610451 [Trichonephila clavata]
MKSLTDDTLEWSNSSLLILKSAVVGLGLEVYPLTLFYMGSNNEMRWRADVRLEAGQSLIGVSGCLWGVVSRMAVSRLWQHFQTSYTITRKTGQGFPRVVTLVENFYVALNVWRHKCMVP